MIKTEQLDRMRQDAQLAVTQFYGYPVARLNCAHHVLKLLTEIDSLQAAVAAAHGDWSLVQELAEPGQERSAA
jgi:hypothetical protein